MNVQLFGTLDFSTGLSCQIKRKEFIYVDKIAIDTPCSSDCGNLSSHEFLLRSLKCFQKKKTQLNNFMETMNMYFFFSHVEEKSLHLFSV